MKHLFLTVFIIFSLSTNAQTKCDFSLGADLVSSYVWRGSTLSGTSIQPAMGIGIGGFYFGTWGSVDIAGKGFKEVDLLAEYSLGNFKFGLYDYWFSSDSAYNYFDYSDDASHSLEANLSYTFNALPLTFGWNTIIAGNDQYLDDQGKVKRAFSTYIEASYAFSIKEIKLDAAIGVSPWRSSTLYTGYEKDGQRHGTDGFAVVNMSLTASRDIKITDKYSLGIFGQLSFNPAKKDAFFVFGIKF